MKWIVGILLLIILGVAGFFAFNNYIYNEKQGDKTEGMGNVNAGSSQLAEIEANITPISHATMILRIGEQIIYNDPVGEAEAFAGQPSPTMILISDIHGDHFSGETLTAIVKEDTVIIVPQAVADQLPENLPGTVIVMNNGEKIKQNNIEIEAVPMYNIPESADARHTKGRGNGYILSADGKRTYIAGDTSATPEMKALQNIDVAFIPMNLPFTMSVEEAAEGVLAFKPKVVHPYHYRGQDGLADVNKFKEFAEVGNQNITVHLLNFYPGE